MRRRHFLGLSLGALGLAGVVAAQPRRVRGHVDATRPARMTSPQHVVVVGGGLAGISAASDLAERGFRVTLFERAPHLGGKVGGWNVRALGEDWPVEHGFHGFFAQYYTLRGLLERAGATRLFLPSLGYPVRFRDKPDEVFGTTTSLFPANLMSVVARSPNVAFADFAQPGMGLLELMRYRSAETFARFDDVDFHRFCVEGGVPASLRDTVLLPFAETTLNRPERLSAAEAIRFFHFYFLGNPEGLRFECTTRDVMTAIVEPLHARLRALGVDVRVGTPVQRLVLRDGNVAGVALGTSSVASTTLPIERVPARGFTAVGGCFVRRDDDGGFLALDARCTHMGCPVALDGAGGFACPCHGGRFDDDGVPTAGPPKEPLRRLPILVEGETLRIGAARVVDDVVACDHCVVACEVRGLQALVRASTQADGTPLVVRGVEQLGESEPYVVLRAWFDKPVDAARAPFATTHRYRFTDSLAVYSQYQEPFRAWALRTGGSVVETHAYALAPADQLAREVIEAAMLDELRALLPELAGARVLHVETRIQTDFSRFAPGDAATRPTTRTEIANLHLAGDHVKLPVPASLMEAAALSGRFAANAILDATGLAQNAYDTVPLAGPLVG
jgi:isorenieratene synthase